MGKHSKRDPEVSRPPDAEVTRRFLLSALVGGATVAGVTVATSGRLYPLDELERVLAQTSPPRELTQAAATPVAPVTSTVAAPRTTSAAPTTTVAPTRAPRTTKQAPPATDLAEKLSDQSTSGWGLKPLAAASAHLIATTFGILTVGGYRASSDVAGSDHPRGLAADFMTSNQKLNRDIGNFAIANRTLLRVKYVISLQHYNDGSGWTLMEDRGSVTANHFDHCHVSFY